LRTQVQEAGWRLCQVERIAPRDERRTMKNFRDQFTKLILWSMSEYDTIVYMDSDCIVVDDVSRLFNVWTQLNSERRMIAVTRDIRDRVWVSTFNMGVFVMRPNVREYEKLLALKNDPSFKFETVMSEQGFLNAVYKDRWFDFGFEYNAMFAVYLFQPEYWLRRATRLKVIHYTMLKPWECTKQYERFCSIWNRY
jgi:glycogenin glucosyltransferase